MINERRLCQLMLPCYILFRLAYGDQERSSRAIVSYVAKYMNKYCDHDKKKMHKISMRLAKVIKEIEYFCAEKDLLKGKKMVLITHFLTQHIFNEKDRVISDTYLEIAKITERLVRFCINLLEKETSEEDLEKMIVSAEKQAAKVYERFYSKI